MWLKRNLCFVQINIKQINHLWYFIISNRDLNLYFNFVKYLNRSRSGLIEALFFGVLWRTVWGNLRKPEPKQLVYWPRFEVTLAVYRIQKPVADTVQINIYAPVKAATFLHAIVPLLPWGHLLFHTTQPAAFYPTVNGPVSSEDVPYMPSQYTFANAEAILLLEIC